MISVYLDERASAGSLFDAAKARYVAAAHSFGDTARGKRMLAAGAASPLASRMTWLASQLAICDLPRMIRVDVPWWNRRAALVVDRFLSSTEAPRIFEYGSGSSTVWLARRGARIVSAEPFREWAEALQPKVDPYHNTELLVRPVAPGGGPFAACIEEAGGPFDLIVIDGRERAACLRAAVPHLAEGGMILFDDTGRARYRRAIADCRLREQRHFGAAFAKPYPDWSSILTR